MPEAIREFRAMNTEVRAVVSTSGHRRKEAERALEEVEVLFQRIESTLSRFLPGSELAYLNASAGQPFHASSILFSVVAEALAAAKATQGLFDPTILGALIRAGYDRSFELLGQIGKENSKTPSPPGSAGQRIWAAIRADSATQTITLPSGCAIDLGGIGKGWTIDQAVRQLKPFSNFAIDAGGDIAAYGVQGNGEPWSVGVEDPLNPKRDLVVMVLRDTAIGTSSTTRRSWDRSGGPQHHLIDPRTGVPASTGVLAATVIAKSVARAEVMAKAALLLGPKGGMQFLNARPDTAGLLVLESGEMQLSANLQEGCYVA